MCTQGLSIVFALILLVQLYTTELHGTVQHVVSENFSQIQYEKTWLTWFLVAVLIAVYSILWDPTVSDCPPRGYSLLVCYFLSHSNHGDLASSLQPGITEELYFSFDQEEILRSSHRGNFLEDVDEEVMKRSVITPDFERKERVPAVNHSRYTLQKMRKVCNPHSTKFRLLSSLLGSDALEISRVCVYQWE